MMFFVRTSIVLFLLSIMKRAMLDGEGFNAVRLGLVGAIALVYGVMLFGTLVKRTPGMADLLWEMNHRVEHGGRYQAINYGTPLEPRPSFDPKHPAYISD